MTGQRRFFRTGLLAIGAVSTPVVVLASQGDPFANPTPAGTASAAATTVPPGAGTAISNAVAAALDPACAHVTEAVCKQANTTLLATAAGYVVVTTLLFLLLRAWMNKKGMSSPAVRLVVPMLGAGAVSGLLVGLDPARGVDAKCCLVSGTLKAQMLLQDSAIGRAFLLGVLPALVLYFVVVLIVGLVRR